MIYVLSEIYQSLEYSFKEGQKATLGEVKDNTLKRSKTFLRRTMHLESLNDHHCGFTIRAMKFSDTSYAKVECLLVHSLEVLCD